MGKTLIERMRGKRPKDYVRFAYEITKNRIDTYKLSKVRVAEWGLNRNQRDILVIVTLTSFPARIQYVSECIKSLLCQSVKPDKVILWLAEEQFPQKENELPSSLLCLREFGLTIEWCEDLKSYKKLVPAIRKYPEAVLVTADDDAYYDNNWLELLYKGYEQDKSCIWCHRVTKIVLGSNSKWTLIQGGREVYPRPSFGNMLVGCGGVLYPPGVLHPDVIRKDMFMELAPTNDDVWFWLMGVLNGTKTAVVDNRIMWSKEVKGTRKSALSRINEVEIITEQMELILSKYPLVRTRILNELK